MIQFGITCLLLSVAYLVVHIAQGLQAMRQPLGWFVHRVNEWLEQDAGLRGSQGASILKRAGLIDDEAIDE